MSYRDQLRKVLTSSERRLFSKLDSPLKIQDFLDRTPNNFELLSETYRSPREMIKSGESHCFEGALFAAAALAYHGHKPLLLDLQTTLDDIDHVVALFREGKYWGAISKTNHPVLRYRDAVYRTPRELALSYFHEYFRDRDGAKTLRAYSAPFDLTKLAPEAWVTTAGDLHALVDTLDWSRHFPIAPKKNIRRLRNASPFERRAAQLTEWKKPRRSKARAGTKSD